VYTLRLLAHRIQHLTGETDELTRRISNVLADHAPHLLERRGVGPDSAATLLITAGDNPERLANEASFAALCGASPIQASSGKTLKRHGFDAVSF
jgi:transposase